MKTLTPIAWSEGMFLKPQHFQQADLFQDARLAYHLRALDAFHRGVARMRIDVDALENMILRVIECEAVFADGLVVRYPEDALVEERSFQDELPPGASSIGVFLAVRALSMEDGAGDRFVRQGETRRDLHMRENEAAIDFLVPRTQIVFATSKDDERMAGQEVLKIAEIRRTGRTSPRFELSPHYVPPSLSVCAAPPLLAMVSEVIERSCAASRTLATHRRERGTEAIGFGTGDYEQLLGRQLLNQHIPLLQHALANEAVHPWHMYGALLSLRGGLTSYWPDEEPWTFPPYDHDDLGNCFGTVCESIRKLLERLIPVHYVEIPLQRDGFQFNGALDGDLFSRGTAWVLALSGGGGEEEMQKRIRDGKGKVTSQVDMPQLLRVAVGGVPLKAVPMPPAEIPRYAGHVYFALDTMDRRWTRVKEAGTFAFYLADAEPDVTSRLFVVLRDPDRGGKR